jgi:hypothetical protein
MTHLKLMAHVRESGILFAAIICVGCGGLSEDKAFDILSERLQRENSQSCTWTHVEGDQFTDVDYLGVRECIQELEQAGIAKAGICRDSTPNEETCLARAITPLNGAVLTKEGLAFHCGDFKLLRIDGIDSDSDDTADVRYVREFDAPLLKKIEHCTATLLRRPEGGQLHKKIGFKRGTDGKWSITEFAVNASLF